MDDLFESFRFCITDNGCKGCPREEVCKIHVDYVPVSKVLALDVLNRLKEQEAVKPILTPWIENDDGEVVVYKMECGKCGIPFYYEEQKYCSECGTPILWEDR